MTISGLIYNLVQFLKNEFPAYVFYTNAVTQQAGQNYVPDNYILIQETGGTLGKNYELNIPTFQVLVNAIDTVTARSISFNIYNKIHNKNGLILPTVTVDGTVYPEFATDRIAAIQSPSYVGKDDNGCDLFSNNYQIWFNNERYF